ncbi:Methyltransf 31 domain containing protein [Trichuris trichiura]|uniref:Methyltransf 31 domain containing protein n=1 Tax=Trichuris trichiura TaxID=36087 RepID=A0A077Z5L8_TRITR|nr:Methyltransf 31 domain containing protein [Trichuris trichiura]
MSVLMSDTDEDSFRNKCMALCNNAYVALALALGYRLKLFDFLESTEKDGQTSAAVASRAGYKERYVREWLGAMVCGGIVECDSSGTKYWLPYWRRGLLRSDTKEGILPMINMISVLSPLTEKILECFQSDGPKGKRKNLHTNIENVESAGTTYSEYKDLYAGMSDFSDRIIFAGLLQSLIPSIDNLEKALGAYVTKRVNYISEEAIAFANNRQKEMNIPNLQYMLCCAATGIPNDWTEKFDFITAFDVIHDQAYPAKVLKQMFRVLKPGGLFSIVDIKGESDLNVDKKAPMSGSLYAPLGYLPSSYHCIGLMMSDTDEDSFRNKCMALCNNAYVALALSLGYRLKLFDFLESTEKDGQTSAAVASRAGYKERYVREWLGAMVCGGIVECDSSGTKYWLPHWRRGLLRSDTKEGIVPMTNMITVLSPLTQKILECFQPDGPKGKQKNLRTSYSEYKDFHAYMSDFSDRATYAGLLQCQLAEKGITVLDIGCGRGTPSLVMAQKFTNSKFYGIDISEKAIAFAKNRQKEMNIPNLQYMLCCAATGIPDDWTEKFDFITAFDVIHDQAYPAKVLKQMFRVLKPGGLFSIVDIKGESDLNVDKKAPMSGCFYTVSLFHCMPVSLHFEGGTGLGTMWGRQTAERMFKEAGFEILKVATMVYNPANYHYLCRKPT